MYRNEYRFKFKAFYLFIGIFLFQYAALTIYEIYISRRLSTEIENSVVKQVSGKITNISRYNAFIEFEVEGVKFLTQEHTNPCLDIRNEVQKDRIVELEYVLIKSWPGKAEAGNCIINASYRTRKVPIRSGRSKIRAY